MNMLTDMEAQKVCRYTSTLNVLVVQKSRMVVKKKIVVSDRNNLSLYAICVVNQPELLSVIVAV